MDLEDKDSKPRDAIILADILKSMEFMHRYVSETLLDAQDYADHARHHKIDMSDLALALQSHLTKSFIKPPSRERLMSLAKERNKIPLPIVPSRLGVLLPPERYCVTGQNYKTPASQSSSVPSSSSQSFPSHPQNFDLFQQQRPSYPFSSPSGVQEQRSYPQSQVLRSQDRTSGGSEEFPPLEMTDQSGYSYPPPAPFGQFPARGPQSSYGSSGSSELTFDPSVDGQY